MFKPTDDATDMLWAIRRAYNEHQPHEHIMAMYAALPDKAEISGDSEKTYFHLAAAYTDIEAMEYLLANGVKANVKDEYQRNALYWLAKGPSNHHYKRNPEDIKKAVEFLLDAKVSPLVRDQGAGGDLCYHAALSVRGSLAFIWAMMENNVKLDMLDKDGNNVLDLLVSNPARDAHSDIHSHCYYTDEERAEARRKLDECFDLARALIDYGIDPEGGSRSQTPAEKAAEEGLSRLAILLKGEYDESDPQLADKIATGGKTLFQAAHDGDLEAVEAHIRLGADVNEMFVKYYDRYDGHTPLSRALVEFHLDCAQVLVDAGADPNVRGGENDTTPFYAFARGIRYYSGDRERDKLLRKAIKLLIDAGLNLNGSVDEKGNTPLNLVCTRHGGEFNDEVRRELLNLGEGDYNLPDNNGVTPMMNLAILETSDSENDMVALLEAGADMTLKDNKSQTALMYAARNHSRKIGYAMADLLFTFGDPMPAAVDNDGKTALDYAVEKENEALVKLIMSNM